MRRNRFASLFLLLLTIGALALSACGGSSTSAPMRAPEAQAAPAMPAASSAAYAEDAVMEEGFDGEADLTTAPALDDRKVIKHAYLSLESTAFDEALTQINARVIEQGGYIESQSADGSSYDYNPKFAEEYGGSYYSRSATITARIPSAKLNDTISWMGELCNVTSRSENMEDITDTYFDAQARITSLRVQEETLLDILTKSEKLEDVITLQQALADVRYQIESLTATIKRMDGQVTYSYLNIDLTEVVSYQPVITVPKTFGEEVSAAFTRSMSTVGDSLQGAVLFIIGVGPVLLVWLLILAIPAALIILIARAAQKRNAARHPRVQPRPPIPSAPNTANGGSVYAMPPTPPADPPES